jgi:hypothetical protein
MNARESLHPNSKKSRPDVMRIIAMRLLPLSSKNFMMTASILIATNEARK